MVRSEKKHGEQKQSAGKQARPILEYVAKVFVATSHFNPEYDSWNAQWKTTLQRWS